MHILPVDIYMRYNFSLGIIYTQQLLQQLLHLVENVMLLLWPFVFLGNLFMKCLICFFCLFALTTVRAHGSIHVSSHITYILSYIF
jgi:hypothetical protein